MFSFFSALDGTQPWRTHDIHATTQEHGELLARALLRVLSSPSWDTQSLPGAPPSSRSGAAMVYDSVRHKTVLFGGASATGLFAETWEYDGEAWNQAPVSGPSARAGHAMVFDSARARIVMFGGQTGQGLSAETWEYDGQWHAIGTPAAPTARAGHAMAYDTGRGRTVLFGGQVASGRAADTFEYDGSTWAPRSASPPSARSGHAMAFDTSRQRTVLFGGETAVGASSGETWEWNGLAWNQIGTPSTPQGRASHSMVYDPVRKHMVLFGGEAGGAFLHSTWEFDGRDWLHRTVTNFAPGRASHAMAFDADRAMTVLFGGEAGALAESLTWEFAAPTVPPVLTIQPAPLAMVLGEHAVFSASTGGDGSLHWQWRKNGVPIAPHYRIRGESSPTLVVEGVTSADAGVYDVVVTNACCSIISQGAGLTLCLDIAAQPVGQYVTVGQALELRVEALGTSPLGYQWYKAGEPVIENARISGAATERLDINPIAESDVGGYVVVVSNDCGSVTSSYAGVVLWGTCGTADFNNDGDLGTDADIEAFFACLGGDCCPTCGSADFNGDGDTGTDTDIEAFFACLGGACCDRLMTPCGSADFNGDGDTGTDADIEAFFACLSGNCCEECGAADFDGNGDTGTDADIEAFFRVLGGGAC